MIYLGDEKNYYIMIDQQGGVFGGYRIFEGIEEVKNQFEEWGDSDEIEDIENMTISDCISLWQIDVKRYNGKDFTNELSDEELNYTNNKIK